MKRIRARITLSLIACLLATPTIIKAADSGETPGLFVGYDPSLAYPFGRLHPDAPPETRQFAFMVGEFDCIDRLRQQDGTWIEFKAIWNAAYFLNGHGIQDRYWNGTFATSNIRIFDRKKDRWMVTFFRMPGYQSGVWEGEKEGDRLVMKQESTSPEGETSVTSRLTFYDITDDGYRWVGESLRTGKPAPFWKSDCRRRH